MDLSLTKSGDDTETDTPPHHPIISFATASFHHHLRQSPPVYKECMKNHAAHIGGHAVDGCGEFMPPVDPTRSGSDTHQGPAALLKCAACGCHRNFHRRDIDTVPPVPPFFDFRHPKRKYSLSPSPPPPPSRLLALSAAAEDHLPMTPITENGRKRFRSKFSEEQKEKMQSFSEKLGWKIQKCDEEKVEEFSRQIGVTKGVLKVWMHNNKNKKLETTRDNKGRIVNGLEFDNGGHGHGGSNNVSSSST